jgi:hypothetical protein
MKVEPLSGEIPVPSPVKFCENGSPIRSIARCQGSLLESGGAAVAQSQLFL